MGELHEYIASAVVLPPLLKDWTKDTYTAIGNAVKTFEERRKPKDASPLSVDALKAWWTEHLDSEQVGLAELNDLVSKEFAAIKDQAERDAVWPLIVEYATGANWIWNEKRGEWEVKL